MSTVTCMSHPTMVSQILWFIVQVLQWTQDWGRAQALAWRLALLYAEEFQQLSEPCPAVKSWLEALKKANVPCALVSHMPAVQIRVS